MRNKQSQYCVWLIVILFRPIIYHITLVPFTVHNCTHLSIPERHKSEPILPVAETDPIALARRWRRVLGWGLIGRDHISAGRADGLLEGAAAAAAAAETMA